MWRQQRATDDGICSGKVEANKGRLVGRWEHWKEQVWELVGLVYD